VDWIVIGPNARIFFMDGNVRIRYGKNGKSQRNLSESKATRTNACNESVISLWRPFEADIRRHFPSALAMPWELRVILPIDRTVGRTRQLRKRS